MSEIWDMENMFFFFFLICLWVDGSLLCTTKRWGGHCGEELAVKSEINLNYI